MTLIPGKLYACLYGMTIYNKLDNKIVIGIYIKYKPFIFVNHINDNNGWSRILYENVVGLVFFPREYVLNVSVFDNGKVDIIEETKMESYDMIKCVYEIK